MMLKCLLAIAFIGSASAFIFTSSSLEKWQDLKVHWGANPLSSSNFAHMPTTKTEAVNAGFEKLSDCDVKSPWRGARYVSVNDDGDKDYSVILLFDVKGYIAGIQTAVPTGQENGYPKSSMQPPFIKQGDDYFLTAYFVDPSIICSTGRTAAQFQSQGTGTVLSIQNGSNPETDSIKVPHQETGMSSTKWTKGKCFYSMGTHYWYNTSEDMSCDDFFPVFVMYNKNELTGFGWAMGADLTSKRLEHPGSLVLPLFFQTVPKCLTKLKVLSTMHIYFRSSYLDNFKC